MRCFLLMSLIVSSLLLSIRVNAQDAARAESERSAAESKRSAAESERSAAESARSAAESKRSGIENASAAAVSAQAAAQSKRVSARNERSAAESARQAKESAQRAEDSLQAARNLAPALASPVPASPSPLPSSKRWATRTVSARLIDDSTSNQSDGAIKEGGETETHVTSYSFSRAAHFAWLAFDREEQPLPRDTLTIYEGMSIDVYHGGNYEVRYQVEAPLVETTLRMQLQFRTNSNNKVGTITLAPVHIQEGRDENRNISSQSYQIVQRGHSVALDRAAYYLREDIKVIDSLPLPPFTRTGTTRFGAVPQK